MEHDQILHIAERIKENADRAPGALKKDDREEEFLETLNRRLAEYETTLYRNIENPQPFVLVLGLPRSGTTLATQLLSLCLDVGYVNNIIARYWLAPVVGARMSQAILGRTKRMDFTSNYGKTGDPSGPHEFSYFWHHWFLQTDLENYNENAAASRIDWTGLQTALFNLADSFGRPMVIKGPFHHVSKTASLLKKCVIVYVTRNVEEVALSLYKARISYYGSPSTWWSIYPEEYPSLRGLDCWDQIAGQIYYLKRYMEREMGRLDGSHIITMPYSRLCAAPREALDGVRARIKELFGTDMQVVNTPPDKFAYSRPASSPERELAVKALAKYF